MSSTETKDEAIRKFSQWGFKYSHEDAREIDKYLQSLPTGRVQYRWANVYGDSIYYIHS